MVWMRVFACWKTQALIIKGEEGLHPSANILPHTSCEYTAIRRSVKAIYSFKHFTRTSWCAPRLCGVKTNPRCGWPDAPFSRIMNEERCSWIKCLTDLRCDDTAGLQKCFEGTSEAEASTDALAEFVKAADQRESVYKAWSTVCSVVCVISACGPSRCQ